MAKKTTEETPTAPVDDTPAAPTGREVLVAKWVDEFGAYVTGIATPDGTDTPSDPKQEIHIGGVPYHHVADAPNGLWIYAPRDVTRR